MAINGCRVWVWSPKPVLVFRNDRMRQWRLSALCFGERFTEVEVKTSTWWSAALCVLDTTCDWNYLAKDDSISEACSTHGSHEKRQKQVLASSLILLSLFLDFKLVNSTNNADGILSMPHRTYSNICPCIFSNLFTVNQDFHLVSLVSDLLHILAACLL